MSDPIEAVVFDLGNVLVTVDEHHALERMAARTCKSLRELDDYVLATPFVMQLALGELKPQRFFEIVSKDLGFDGDYQEFAQIWAEIFSPIEPMIAYAGTLKGRLPRIILSNTNAIHMEYIFVHFPLIHDFEGHVLSHEVGLMKPDCRIYELALQKFNLTAARTVFIDDIRANVEGARAVGMPGIHFRNPAQTQEELTKLGVAGI